MAEACTIDDMYKNFQILADAKEKAGEVTVYELFIWVSTRVDRSLTNYRSDSLTACRGPYKPRTGHTGMNMHLPYWLHRPYTVYMAVLWTKQGTVKLSKMLVKCTHRPACGPADFQMCKMRIVSSSSAAECGKATRGNLRNVPHLIFRKLPRDNFPHSAIRIPQNTRARRKTLHFVEIFLVGMALCALYARYKTSRNQVLKIQQNILAYEYISPVL